MHELGIVFHIIKQIEDVGEENKLSAVSSVTLELGEVSGVLNEYLEDCWNWACRKNQLMNGAKLIIEQIPAITLCESCNKQYSTTQYGKICPNCSSSKTYLLSGNEVMIKEIEAL